LKPVREVSVLGLRSPSVGGLEIPSTPLGVLKLKALRLRDLAQIAEGLEIPSTPLGVLKQDNLAGIHIANQILEIPSTPLGVLKHHPLRMSNREGAGILP